MVNKMRIPKIILALMCLTLFAICFLPTCASFEASITVIEEKNISFNFLDEQEYDISKNASVAMIVEAISINSTMPMGKNASLVFFSMNFEGDETQQLNQSEFSSFMEAMFIGAIKLAKGTEIESTMAKSAQGKNVTLNRVLMPATKNGPANETIMAFWDLDEYTHAILTSELDLNTTTSIVETLEIRP